MIWLKILGWLSGIDWKKLLSLALKYWYVLLIAFLYLQDHHRGKVIEEQKRKITGYTEAIDTLKGALENNKIAIAECKRINHQNDAELERQKQLAAKRSERIAALERQANTDVEKAHAEANKLRNVDTECRTADDPLPEFIISGVRQPGADRSH